MRYIYIYIYIYDTIVLKYKKATGYTFLTLHVRHYTFPKSVLLYVCLRK